MLGAIFVSEAEKATVEGGVAAPKLLMSPLAKKMRKPEFLCDEAREAKKGDGQWAEGDFEYAVEDVAEKQVYCEDIEPDLPKDD